MGWDTAAEQLPPLCNGAVYIRKKLLDVARLAGLVRTIEVGLPPDVRIFPAVAEAVMHHQELGRLSFYW